MIQNCFTSASLLFSSPSSTNHFTEYQSTSSSKPLVFQNILHRMQGCCWGEGAGRRRAHSDRALNRQHSSAQALAATSSYTSFLILYSRNHSKVTLFSDPGPRQAPSFRSHLLICYYCQALLPGQSIAEGKDLQQRLLCRQPLPVTGQSLLQDSPRSCTVTAAALSGYDYIKFWVSSYACDKFLLIK